ncbi:DUF6794 domain-containing protein [Paramagnetospirillum magneticum]|uniref:DUF6794 domain-containing protein n=1 Tax=Paramagnetospirillum magneticum TaxID=84159 RepID=UPI0011D05649|nr:DUF6794 domain-containing protein [Paramagnetospirillum magneticum]
MTEEADILEMLKNFIMKYPEDERKKVKDASEDDLWKFHRGLGMSLRNALFWGKSNDTLNAYTKSLLCAFGKGDDFFIRKNIHADGMSGDAIFYIWSWLNGKCN